MSIKIALAGNPNCGKTTMFNDLTGSSQSVSYTHLLRAVDGWAHIRFIQILEATEYVETLDGDDCIHLPLLNRRIVRALSGEDKAAPDIVWEPEQMENVRVLIVDDSPVNLQVAAGLLEPYHMAVDLAASGAEAVSYTHLHDRFTRFE